MKEVVENHFDRMANQLIDSQLESTRIYWREKVGVPKEYWYDPRSIEIILESIKD